MNNKKLRIGLLLDSYSVPFWLYKMVQEIDNSDHSEVILVVRKKAVDTPRGSKLGQFWNTRHVFLYRLYTKLENKIFKPSPNAFAKKDLNDILNCDEVVVSPKGTKFSDRIVADDISKIKEYNIDVFIRVGFKILRGDILKSSKFGVWSYHHGDGKVNRGGPAGAWEVLEGWPESGVLLQILTENLDGGVKLFESASSTDYLSINRNKNKLYWKARSFLPRKLKELHRVGEVEFLEGVMAQNKAPFFYYNRLYKTPRNWEFFLKLSKKYINALFIRIRNIFYFNQWILLFKLEKEEHLSQSFYRFKRMVPPKDRFWADPFIVYRDNKYFIFLEELEYRHGKGNISVIEMDENGKYGEPQIVLNKEYHLSYPFIHEEDGELYMIPETSENKTIELYKCTEFPLKWEQIEVIFDDIVAVDTTIFKYNGKYWMFTALKENEGAPSGEEQFLFYSDSLVNGNWQSHPKNPIVSDVKYARPAGNVFHYKGNIYKPSQNCSIHYGYGMQIREIITLNESEYKEKQIQSIHPNWGKDVKSTHTLNWNKSLTITDAFIKRSRYF